MLIVTRKVGERLMIGDDIYVVALGCDGNQMKLGIEAPKHITVHREEVYDRIKEDGPNKPAGSD